MKHLFWCIILCLVPHVCLAQLDSISVIGSNATFKSSSFEKEAVKLASILANQKKKIYCINSYEGISSHFVQAMSRKKADFTAFSYKEETSPECNNPNNCVNQISRNSKSLDDQISTLLKSGDGIVFLPGGFDVLYAFSYLETLVKDEILYPKPIVFLNTNHFWDRLQEMLTEMKRQNILSSQTLEYIAFENKPDNVVKTLEKINKKIKSDLEKKYQTNKRR